METETIYSTSFNSRDSSSVDSSLFTFGIPGLIERMKHGRAWENGGLSSMILLRSPGKEVILTALHEGTEIISFHSKDKVILQVIEGRLNFQSHDKTMTLSADQHLAINERMKFSLTSMTETVFLLTILKDLSVNQNVNPK
jgi:hypothetical protein